jgi:hypothetical protein
MLVTVLLLFYKDKQAYGIIKLISIIVCGTLAQFNLRDNKYRILLSHFKNDK